MVNKESGKTAEEFADSWPLPGNCDLRRWHRILRQWREADPPLLLRHVHYELLYRDGHAIYVYDERRVLHLVWHNFEKGFHPLCTQLMQEYGKMIKSIVTRDVSVSRVSRAGDSSSTE